MNYHNDLHGDLIRMFFNCPVVILTPCIICYSSVHFEALTITSLPLHIHALSTKQYSESLLHYAAEVHLLVATVMFLPFII